MTTVPILSFHLFTSAPLIFAENKRPKYFNMKDHTVPLNVSVNNNHYNTVIPYRSIFCAILMAQFTTDDDEMLQA